MAAGMLVAAVVHGGVLRHVRGGAMERDRGEGEGRERVRESQGVRGDAGEIQGDGDAGRQGGGGRGACRRAASRALPTGLGRKTTGRRRWAGPNLLGHQVSGPQVSLCFLFYFFLFSIFAIMF